MLLKRVHSIMVMSIVLGLFLLVGCGSPEDAPEGTGNRPAPPATPSPETTTPAEPTSSDQPAAAPDAQRLSEMPEVVARVGKHEITRDAYRSELYDFQVQLYVQKTGQLPLPHVTQLPALSEEQRAAVLNSMIEARIFADLAAESGITVSGEEVDAKLEELKNQAVTENEYARALERSGLSEDKFRENIRLRLLMQKYGDSLVEHTELTEAQLELPYKRLREQGALKEPRTADIAHIFLAVDPDVPGDEQAVKKNLEEIRGRVVGGEDIGEVAKEVSEDPVSAPRGGLYERVRKGQLGQGFDDRLFTAPLGEVSEPFRSIKGWHIMKVLEHHPPRELTLEEARPGLEKMLLSAQRREAMARKAAEARPSRDVEVFIDLDLRRKDDTPIIPVPADALKNPLALPEGSVPDEAPAASAESPEPAAPDTDQEPK